MTADGNRRRVARRVFYAGPILGAIGAVILGLAGFDGRAGFSSVVILTALGAVAALLVGAVLAIIDEARDKRVSRRRLLQLAAFFATAASCIVVLVALATSAQL